MRIGALPNQEGMYLLSRIPALASVYNLFHVLRVRGRLDRAALLGAWRELVRRHDALRSSFVLGPAGLVQEFHDAADLEIEAIDLGALPAAARVERVAALARHEAQRPFDLHRAPLLRVTHVTLAPDESLLFTCLHHLVVDGWSYGILLRDFVRIYGALREGARPALAAAPRLADVMRAAHEELAGEAMARHRAYWLGRLAGVGGNLEIAPDRGAAGGEPGAAIQVRTTWPAGLSRRVRELAHREGGSPFAMLAAATRVLLARYGGDPGGRLHVPFANRARHPKVCGFFVNTLPLCTTVEPSSSFAAFLRTVRDELRAASEHQAYPGALLDRARAAADAVDPARVAGSIFELAPVTTDGVGVLELGGCALDVVEPDVARAPFGLAIAFARSRGPLRLTLTARADLYTPRLAEQAAADLRTLVERLVARPELPLGRIALGERDRAAPRARPRGTLHGRFEAQARRTPARVALEDAGGRLTYRALDRRATALGAALREAGVGPGDLVGVTTEPGAAAIVALLAILKSGAAFVPLGDGRDRAARRRQRELAALAGCRVVVDGARVRAVPGAAPSARAAGLAYVLFTSGTTGRPRGVLVEHGSIVGQLAALRSLPAVRAARRFVLLSPLVFDAALEQVFLPLTSGGTLLVPPARDRRDPRRLWRFVRDARVDVLDTVPSLMHVLADCAPPGTRVPLVILGAEPLSASLVRQVRARLAPRTILNTYGPTETTINATVHDCRDVVPAIGRPLPGYAAHVLDADGNPVPDGVPGELFIGGVGVARGYLDDDVLTAERFVADPTRAGERLYASGDLVRRDRDGNLHFLGRRDDQMKLYGVRVEPGEIVAQLLGCPGVTQAAVRLVDRGPEGRGRHLVACLQRGRGYDEEAVRAELRRRLPDYLVPSVLCAVDELPVLPSGKCDWSRVPVAAAPAVVAAAPVEGRAGDVARVMQDALALPHPVGDDDDFFALGGSSLEAMEAAVLAERRGLRLEVADIYEARTPRRIARRMRDAAARSPAVAPAATPPAPAGRRTPPRRTDRLLLTGATGLLGAHLGRELLEHGGAALCCLVRGRDDRAATARLRRVWAYYFGGARAARLCRRVRVVAGDVTEERLGLAADRWDELRRELSGVVHAAASVRYFDRAEALHAVNADGTQRVADLCVASGAWLAHASTLGVESAGLGQVPYVTSKRTAEAVLLGTAGLDVTILRIGLLTGRHDDGWFQPNLESNAFYTLLRAALAEEPLPELPATAAFHVTPVDQCSRAFRLLVEARERPGPVLPLWHPRPVTLDALVALARGVDPPPAGAVVDPQLAATQALLARRGFAWGAIDAAYVARLRAFLERAGRGPR